MNPSSIRNGPTAAEIKRQFQRHLRSGLGRIEQVATPHDLYLAFAMTVREFVLADAAETIETYGGADARRVAYLSAEYLPGPHLANNLLSLGITAAAREALASLGHDLDAILAEEEEPGLGNGGRDSE